jgi:hypothetical protein
MIDRALSGHERRTTRREAFIALGAAVLGGLIPIMGQQVVDAIKEGPHHELLVAINRSGPVPTGPGMTWGAPTVESQPGNIENTYDYSVSIENVGGLTETDLNFTAEFDGNGANSVQHVDVKSSPSVLAGFADVQPEERSVDDDPWIYLFKIVLNHMNSGDRIDFTFRANDPALRCIVSGQSAQTSVEASFYRSVSEDPTATYMPQPTTSPLDPWSS